MSIKYENLPESVKKRIAVITFNNDPKGHPTPFGSAVYRNDAYPGDFDFWESYPYNPEHLTEEDVIKGFIRRLKNILKNKPKNTYFSELKTGFDHRFIIDIGKMTESFYEPNPNLLNILSRLKKIFRINDYNNILILLNYLNTTIDRTAHQNIYDEIYTTIRMYRILRWNEEEINNGFKILPGNLKYTLKQALKDYTMTKIDIIAEINGRLVETTNIIEKKYMKRGELHYIGIPLIWTGDYLERAIEQLFCSNMHYSPFKAIKRMYSLTRKEENLPQEKEITLLLRTRISSLGQTLSLLKAITRVISISKNIPVLLIKNELDGFKYQLMHVTQLTKVEVYTLIEKIDSMLKTRLTNTKFSRQFYINSIKNLTDEIEKLLTEETIEQLTHIKQNPPSNEYLPKIHTYKSIARTVTENPRTSYKEFIETILQKGYNELGLFQDE